MQNFQGLHNYATDLADIAHQYQGYQRLMAHWNKALPLPILELPYEQLVADPDNWTQTLYEFTGLDQPQPEAGKSGSGQENRIVKTASQLQVRQPIHKGAVARWKHYEAHLGPLLEAFPDYAE